MPQKDRFISDSSVDELDEDDLVAIEESEQQVARGEDLDCNGVSARLRKEYEIRPKEAW